MQKEEYKFSVRGERGGGLAVFFSLSFGILFLLYSLCFVTVTMQTPLF